MKKRFAEYRATSKSLVEQRNDKVTEMQALVESVKRETRAMSAEELAKFTALEKEIAGIDETIKVEERARLLTLNVVDDKKKVEIRAELEEKAFENYIRGKVEARADVNLTVADNGAVIPSSIANKIIKKVIDICPIYQLATRYNVGGSMSIPYYDEATMAITMAYAAEFTDLTSTSGKFTSITLTGFLAGALSKVSKSLVNNSNFDLVNFVINAMADAVSKWIENELLNGTTDKIVGLSGATQKVDAASETAVTADELIDLQEEVPDLYQSGAIWVMNKATRKAIRKLKDGDGNYLLNKDFNAKWGYTLLGKDVYTSANMSKMLAGKTAIYYGEMDGLAVKLAESVSIEVLREVFAAQHAIGVVAWIEIDSKVENAQKIAKLVMKAGA